MIALERDVRTDERQLTLDRVEALLFRTVIGTSADDPLRVAEHNRRMKQFMHLSDVFHIAFDLDWPNR